MAAVPSTEAQGKAQLKKGFVVLISLALFVLVAFALARPAMTAVASLLDVGSEPARADLIFLLGGDIHTRPSKAAELYRRGVAPKVLLARAIDSEATKLGALPNETDAAARLLQILGVPDSAVVVLRPPVGVSSTTAEAVELRKYLLQNPASRVLVVTSSYHTRRARWQIKRQLYGIPTEVSMVAVYDPRFDESNWWRTEPGIIVYTEEYLKFVHNWIFGVAGRR